jgi:hypothetical protein
MKRALVVKALTDQIILVRMDSGDLVSLSVPCRTIIPGTLLLLDFDSSACPVHNVDGKTCNSICHRQNHVMIIEHKDNDPSAVPLSNRDTDRHVI